MIQVSFSGGRSSAMMAKIMLDNYPKDELLFTLTVELIDELRSKKQ